eukprot:3879759-Amphidinium_carterae.1
MPATSSESMKAGSHTIAIANKPFGLALFKRSDRGQGLSSIDGLFQPRECQPDTFTRVRVVTNTTPSKVRITTVFARAISPHNLNTKPASQSRFMDDNALL